MAEYISQITLPDNHEYDIKAKSLSPRTASNVLTGTGTVGSYTNNTYYPAKWTFNTGSQPNDGDIVTIKIPVAGHDYGVFMSVDNGSHYYPVVLNGTERITTHYPINTYITVIFEPTGSAASMYALAGQTSSTRTTVTGGVWRVLNYRDTNSNDTGYYHRRVYPNLKAGGAIHPYSIIMQLPNGRWSGITTTAPNNPGKSNVSPVATGKTANASGFMLGHVLLMYANTTYADANNIGTYNIWSAHTGLIDARYSFNLANSTGNGFVAYTPVYIVGTVSDGLFHLDATKWWTQTLPSSDDGKVYIYIGDAYDWYRLTFTEDKPMYWYKDGAIRLYSGASEYALSAPLSGISDADDLKAIEAISDTSGLLKKTAANTWTLDTNTYLTTHRTYTAVSGKKPTGNQTPGFGSTFDIEQVGQDATGQVSVTERTVTIPSTEASTSAIGLVGTGAQTFGGIKTFMNGIEIKGHIAGDSSGTTGHGLYGGGMYHNAYNNIILHGDASTGSSGIAFISDKVAVNGTITNRNAPSDRAFIQYHACGVTTATAEGTNPTLASGSEEAGRLVIGIGNDSGDKIILQAPGDTDIVHQKGATGYPIPHTTNTNGSVGGTTTPVYVEAGIIKAGTALGGAAYKAENYYALSNHNHDSTYSYIHLTDYDFTDTRPLSKYVTFDKSKPVGAPKEEWYNGFISSHSNYHASYIINGHTNQNEWYVGHGIWREDNTPHATAPTWYLLAHSGNVSTGDNNGQVKIAGQNVSVKGLKALAYKDSLTYSDVGAAPAVTGGYLPLSGGTMTGDIKGNASIALGTTANPFHNIVLGGATNGTLTANSTNPRITFQESNGVQPVHLIYSDYDNYRSPAGLKIIGGTSATPAWLEVEGNVYAAAFKGKADTAYHTSAAHWSTQSGSSTGILKVKIKKIQPWMLAFTIRVYQAYTYDDYVISGYNYGSNKWYKPKATILGSESTSKHTVTFGYDDDANSSGYSTLWVSIPMQQYTGIDIFNITNGYSQITDMSDAFEIIHETESTGTVQTTVDCYRPWYRNEIVSNATTAVNLSVKPSLAASDNNITVTAGGKTSDAFTVPYATSAGYATRLSFENGRIASANLDISTMHSRMLLTLASSGMTTGKPPMGDGYIVTYGWDNAHWGAQQAISHTKTPHMAIRGTNGGSTSDWGEWIYLLDANNYTDYTVTKTGEGASGSWGISITGTAAKATADASGNTITSTYATKAEIEGLLAAANAMIFRGVINAPNDLPNSHSAGDTYRVGAEGTYPIVDSNGRYCEEGTLIICITNGTAANAAHWTAVETNEDGAVIGPASSKGNNIVTFSGNTGRIIQDSGKAFSTATPGSSSTDAQIPTAKAVWAAINALDANLNNTTPDAGKTLTAFSQTDGKVSATFGDISITKSQVSDFAHDHDSAYLKLNGSNNMTADVNIIAGDTDKFVNFWYNANKTAGASWRIGELGSGSSDANYFVIQSGTSDSSKTAWNDTIQIGANTFNVYLPSTTASTSTTSGALKVAGGLGVAGQVTATRLAANGSNTSYNLYVNGTSYFKGNVTHDGIVYFKNDESYYINKNAQGYLDKLQAGNIRLTENKVEFYTTNTDVSQTSNGNSLCGDISATAATNTSTPAIMSFNIVQGASLVNSNFSFNGDIIPQSNATYNLGSISLHWKTAYINNTILVSAKAQSISSYNDSSELSYISPGLISVNINGTLSQNGSGYYLINAGQQYARLYIYAIGKTDSLGQSVLELGNSVGSGTANNAYGTLHLYNTDTTSARYTATGWTGSGISNFTILGATSTTQNTAAWSTLILGNNKNVTTTDPHSQGLIRIYSKGTVYTDIQSQVATSGSHTVYLPKYGNDMYLAHVGDNNAVGSGTQPVYVAENGRITASTNTVGDAYTPVYSNAGVLTATAPVQYNEFTIVSADTQVDLNNDAYTADTYVLTIVIKSGEANINAPITWTSSTGKVRLQTSVAVSGDVSGYILTARGISLVN